MIDQAQVLRDHRQFQVMPVKIQEWILASPHATGVSGGFFNKGRVIEPRPATQSSQEEVTSCEYLEA